MAFFRAIQGHTSANHNHHVRSTLISMHMSYGRSSFFVRSPLRALNHQRYTAFTFSAEPSPSITPLPTQATTDKSPCTMEARQVSDRCAIRQSHLGQGHREWQTPPTITFGSCRLETSRAPSSYKNYHAHSWTIPSFFCAINTRQCEIALLYMGRLLWNVASV